MNTRFTQTDIELYDSYRDNPVDLSYANIREFSSIDAFMFIWAKLRNPEWLHVNKKDVITLGKDNKKEYTIKYIDYYKDKIQLAPFGGNVIYEVRSISNIPYMKVTKRAIDVLW